MYQHDQAPLHLDPVTDIHLLESITWIAFQVRQVFQLSGISQLVDVDDGQLGILAQFHANKVRTDKSAAAGDKNRLHVSCRGQERRNAKARREGECSCPIFRGLWQLQLADSR